MGNLHYSIFTESQLFRQCLSYAEMYKKSYQFQSVCSEPFLGSLLYNLYDSETEKLPSIVVGKSISLVVLVPAGIKVW